MELITISSRDGLTDDRLKSPEADLFPKGLDTLKFTNKKVIFLTSRVHPGETPGSHSLNGLLNLLVSDLQSEQAKTLRRHFVFKIIPMLNPDGVARGYYRLDTKAQNLNRFYVEASKELHPTIYAFKKLIA